MPIQSLNPSTGEIIKTYKEQTSREVVEIISKTDIAFQSWKKTTFAERSRLMKVAAQVLRDEKEIYSRLMAQEMGKPIRDGRIETEKCASVCDYYAENSESFLQNEMIKTEAGKSYVAYQPLGPVLAVMPWNFPFWQVFRFAAPALMAGNVGILKHASNVPGCALAIENVFVKAGFPDNVFRTLLISSGMVEAVIENPSVKAATLTGSTPAGKAVAKKAGEMLKKTVLELGGSDPYIVLEDADIAAAVTSCVTSRLINAGQSCIAAKRFIVVETIKDEFEHLYIEQQGDFLKHCFRVLQKEGTLCMLGIPDFEETARCYLEKRPIGKPFGGAFDLYQAYRLTHGDYESVEGVSIPQMHKTLFDTDMLNTLFSMSEFSEYRIFRYKFQDEKYPITLGVVASKGLEITNEKLESVLSPFNSIITDLEY